MFDLSRHEQYQHELAGTPSSVAFVNDSHQQSQLRNLSFYDFIFEVSLAFSASRNLDCLEPQILFRRVTHDKFHSSVDHVSPHTQKQYIRISPISF